MSTNETPAEGGENLQVAKAGTSSSDSIFTILYSALKKIALVGSIYGIGYMNWSVAWLIGPIVLSLVRDEYKKTSEEKRQIAKMSALANEKDVILTRIKDLPAWVYFPDVERCEWVNKLLKQVWPNANHFARTLVKETIEPNVTEALANYKMSGFRFDRIILGNIPPRIGGIKVYDKNVDRNELTMDIDLFYASDCDINFYLGGLKGGIKDFQISGLVRVVMKPLITNMPLVGGLQIFFLNNPDIDFNLVGVVDLLDMPGLSDLLRRIIIEQFAAIMVLPNKLPITLSEEIPRQLLRMPEPEGVLRIHVVEAKDLMKKDIGVLGKGKSDPYAVINVGALEFKTQVIDNNVNPKWDYWCEATIFAENEQTIELSLFDYDGSSNDEKLGRASVEIKNVVEKGVLDTWLTLEEAKHGMVHVRLSWYKLTTSKDDLDRALKETQLLKMKSMSTSLLTVYVDSAKSLPHPKGNANPDPYLIVNVGNQKEQSPVQMRTDSPIWEKGYTFLISNLHNDIINFKIMDQKTGSTLGKYSCALNTILSHDDLTIVSQPFHLQQSGPESKIILSMSLKFLQKSFDESSTFEDEPKSVVTLSRTPSVQSTSAQMKPVETFEKISAPIEEAAADIFDHPGEFNLGRIQISLKYSNESQKLNVTLHKIIHIPNNDPSNIPDPYVKFYLLPGRSKDSKRKTEVMKDNCNPVYNETFQYLMSTGELLQSELEVTVCSQKGFLYGGSPVIGMVKLPLADPEISTRGLTIWSDLLPDSKMHAE